MKELKWEQRIATVEKRAMKGRLSMNGTLSLSVTRECVTALASPPSSAQNQTTVMNGTIRMIGTSVHQGILMGVSVVITNKERKIT